MKSIRTNTISYHQKLLNSVHEIKEFRKIPEHLRGFILVTLPQFLQKKIIRGLSMDELSALCKYLDADDIADIIQFLNPKRGKLVLNKLERYEKEKTKKLLEYHPETAGGLTSLDYIIVYQKTTFTQVKEKIKSHIQKFNHLPSIIVTNKGQVVGMLPLKEVFIAKDKYIQAHIQQAKTIKASADQEELLKIFTKNDRENIVVLDDTGAVFGIVKTRDLIPVVKQEATEDIYHMAGLEKDESVLDGVFKKMKSRSKWLIINLMTAFLAATVIGVFESTLDQLVILAIYLPVIAAMGGNAGVQALTVVTRGMALNQVNPKTAKKLILNEVLTGILNGAIIGLIVAIIAIIFHHNPLLGFVAFLSMIIALLAATFFGTIAPMILKKFNIDPAVAAGVFVTTSTDIFGFLAFLGLANIFIV